MAGWRMRSYAVVNRGCGLGGGAGLRADRVTSFLLATVLVAAVAMTVEARIAGVATPYRAARFGSVIAASVELLIAAWLLSRWQQRVAWRVTVVCFIALGAVALGRTVSSATGACGCFGRLEVPPWVAFAIDVGALCLLGWSRSAYWRANVTPMPFAHSIDRKMAAGCLSFALGAAVLSHSTLPSVSVDAGATSADGRTIWLQPEAWLGKTFPILKDLRISSDISRGSWLVVLHRHNCRSCARLLARLQAQTARRTESALALIEMPPFAPSGPLRRVPRGATSGHLDPSIQWNAETPIVLTLNDGIVESYTTDLPRIEVTEHTLEFADHAK